MTIEALLERNNALLEQLVEKFSHIGVAAAPATAAGAQKTQEAAPAVTPAASATPPAAPSPAPAPAAAGPLDYDKDIKPVALSVLAKRGKEAFAKLLTEWNVGNARDVAPEKQAAFLAALKKAAA